MIILNKGIDMGFGVLLLGYFLAFAFSLINTYFYADVIGGLIMLYSFSRLMRYNEKFKRPVYAVMAFCTVSMVKAIIMTFGLSEENGIFSIVMSVISAAIILVLHIYMLSAISDMAIEAEEPRISNRAKSNMLFITVYYILYIIMAIVSPSCGKEFSAYVNLFSFVFGVLYVFLNSFLIYSCFSTFVVIGEEISEPKQSKIKLINAIRMRSYEKKKKIAEENEQMAQASFNQKSENGRYKPKKKKKKK